MNIAQNIKAIRVFKKVCKADMAKALDMDFSQYSRQESRDSKLTLEQIEKIAGALGIGLIELLTWGDEKPQGATEQALAAENEQLKRRVAELEDWLEDKRTIIRILQNQQKP